MSEIKYQPEQQKVLDSNNKNLIVSASAGSGKTTIMIQKIIDLISKKEKNVKEILVLTYTKASADEMKQRLVNALYEKANLNKKLITQIDEIALADISTIHSFFQKKIKKYFMELKINPCFNLIDDTLMKKIREEALENTLAKYLENSSEKYQELIEIYGRTRNEKNIKEIIEKLYNFSRALDNPNFWFDNIATSLYSENLNKNLAVNIVNSSIFDASNYYISKLKYLQKEFANKNLGDYVEVINKYLSTLELVNPNPEMFVKNCVLLTNLPSVIIRKNQNFMEEYTKIYDLIDTVKKYSQKVKSWHFEDEKNNFQSITQTKNIVKIFIEMTKLFIKEFDELKQKKNVLDYDDLEKYMLQLLQNESIKEEIKNSYIEIFVDEYQDANRVQEKILSLIAKPDNRFMVGDVKQSIYAFRQAEPDIFLEKLNEYLNDSLSEVMYLNCNYRSKKTILDFVNIIFENIMTNKTAKIDYKTTSKLNGQAEYKEILNQTLPTVSLEIVKKSVSRTDVVPEQIYKVKDHLKVEQNLSSAEIEAFTIVDKIKKFVGQKIYMPSTQTEKTIDFSDITILLKSRGNYLPKLCAVFDEMDIPYYANTNIPLYEDSSVILLINILKLCINSKDDIAMSSVMHSVFGKFSFDEMSQIRLASNQKEFYKCVQEYNVSNKIKEKINDFNQFLTDFTFDATYLGLNKTFEKYVNIYDYETFLLKTEDGVGKTEKIKKFIADFLTNSFNFDIVGFLNFAEINKDTIMAPSVASGYNCVNITTIHSSKGLEYPIVILANMGQSLTKTPFEAEIKLNQKLGVGLKFYNKETRQKFSSIPYEAISITNKNEEFAEKLRLLYVGLTRAKNHLLVVGTSYKDFAKINNDFETLNTTTYLELIVNSLNSDLIQKINHNENYNALALAINITDGDNFTANVLKTKNVVGGSPDTKTMQILQDYYNYKYPYDRNIAYKNSVSGIMQEENKNYVSQNYSPKTFVLGEHLEDKAEDIGILYHKALEEINFFNITTLNDVQNFLQSKSYADKLDAQNIFNSVMLLKQFDLDNVIKEQKFVMKIKHNEIIKSGSNDEILIQGIIDLVILGKKNILIDYKYTKIIDEFILKNKYKIQLNLYKKSTESALNKRIDSIYLLILNQNKLIKID